MVEILMLGGGRLSSGTDLSFTSNVLHSQAAKNLVSKYQRGILLHYLKFLIIYLPGNQYTQKVIHTYLYKTLIILCSLKFINLSLAH